MGANPSDLFHQIENSCKESNCPLENKNRNDLIDQVMEYFDKDKSGVLTDFEVVNLLDTLTRYVMEKLSHKKQLRRGVVCEWIGNHLDVNNDGRITREELRAQLGKMLDSVEKINQKYNQEN